MSDPYTTFKPPGVLSTAGAPGHNEHGIPLHACNGHRHDEHYWAWLGHIRRPDDGAATMCSRVDQALQNPQWSTAERLKFFMGAP